MVGDWGTRPGGSPPRPLEAQGPRAGRNEGSQCPPGWSAACPRGCSSLRPSVYRVSLSRPPQYGHVQGGGAQGGAERRQSRMGPGFQPPSTRGQAALFPGAHPGHCKALTASLGRGGAIVTREGATLSHFRVSPPPTPPSRLGLLARLTPCVLAAVELPGLDVLRASTGPTFPLRVPRIPAQRRGTMFPTLVYRRAGMLCLAEGSRARPFATPPVSSSRWADPAPPPADTGLPHP